MFLFLFLTFMFIVISIALGVFIGSAFILKRLEDIIENLEK